MPIEGVLRLGLNDFAPDTISQRYKKLNQAITIPYKDLVGYLVQAEERENFTKHNLGARETHPHVVRKRTRNSTPPEELASEDELRFEDGSKREEKRAALADKDFVPSPGGT